MENDMNKNIRFKEVEKRVKKIKGFYIHLMVYVLVNLFVIGMIAIKLDQSEKLWSWNLIQLPLFWGIGLMSHAFTVFLPSIILGRNWEEKKIKELMDKDKP